MDSKVIIKALQQQHPGKTIIKNDKNNPTEILCEIDPTSNHSDYSIAIAVIDKSAPHYHKQTEETYEVLKGTLTLYISPPLKGGVGEGQLTYQSITLNPGDTYTIKPGTTHYATGNETWIKATSHPGWTFDDHILIKSTA